MKYPIAIQVAVLAAVLSGGSARAQAVEPSAATPGRAGAVVTDVGPAPAEERNSTGAIVLENSLVRAQRDDGFTRASSRNGVASVGRRVLRATTKAQRDAQTAQARQEEEANLHRLGSGALQAR